MGRSPDIAADVLFDRVPTPLFRITRSGERLLFVDSNRSGWEMTGGAIESLYGRDIAEIWSRPEHRHLAEVIERAQRESRQIDRSFWHRFVADDRERYIRVSVVPLGGDDVMLFVYDLTEERDRMRRAFESNAKYEALFARSRTGLAEGTPQNLMDCNAQLCELLGYPKEELLGLTLEDLSHADDLGLAERALAAIERDPYAVSSWSGRALRRDGSELWCEVTVTGVVDADGKLVHLIAAIEDISERLTAEARIRSALLDTVRAVAATVEARDPYTAGHMERVSQIAVRIAGRLGMDAPRIEGLRLGGLIHDIGKIALPIDILNKPGRLSPREHELVKDHVQIGYEILRDIDFPWPLGQMVVQHHERLDGTGYPNGLRGEAILLESRIIAVADVAEAVSNHRPYRAAHDVGATLEILRAEKGRLDPEIVDCCLALIRDGEIVCGGGMPGRPY